MSSGPIQYFLFRAYIKQSDSLRKVPVDKSHICHFNRTYNEPNTERMTGKYMIPCARPVIVVRKDIRKKKIFVLIEMGHILLC